LTYPGGEWSPVVGDVDDQALPENWAPEESRKARMGTRARRRTRGAGVVGLGRVGPGDLVQGAESDDVDQVCRVGRVVGRRLGSEVEAAPAQGTCRTASPVTAAC
jgi:hypothetical protein